MKRALGLAMRGAGQVAPNPLVGAVLVRDGEIVGEGWHARFGDAHAEVVALRAAGAAAAGATMYVTLEPCNHHGKTPPCTDALIAAGIRRVVCATSDPNSIAGGGAARLTAAGIDVSVGTCEQEARELNAPFFWAQRQAQRPWVTLKLAISIDGAIVDASRARGWLTGPEARQAVHALRAQADAIAIGIGTALADDPLLTVREVPLPRVAPLRVVFDRTARLPTASALARSAANGPPVVACTDGRRGSAQEALVAMGVQLVEAPSLPAALEALRARGVHHLLVEGGATLGSALMAAGLVDRLITFQAPVVLGEGALSAFATLPSQAAETAPRFRIVDRQQLGADLMTTYAVSGD
ncbi:MAG: bifunctional diaminohydroxyphosphoribosylaminopyrimidine deaminase/5-amino-6-(5-phosphoribosylamino)uracil reductase RibD [Gemmatimonadaceae bacterium]|nr:bifunctional diaminohydroxyphosphoribosylaminopyrimidine deaminase/5-amino-6-(5-phosphoribosylamino)uracil reductase RibD [Gemmatimonadaceae bacterium]